MLKKIVNIAIAVMMCIVAVAGGVEAESQNHDKIQSIISGQQDLLVLATINEKGTSAYEIEVVREIGAIEPEEQQNGENSEDSTAENVYQKDIFVEGLTAYMYYDNYDYQPKKGDNVLLSLTFNGNVYSVKNGAFKVDYADIDNFNFVIPDGVGSDVTAELSALYLYVESDGKRGDIFVEDNKVYAYNADGRQEEIIGQFGLKFIDEFGDTTQNTVTTLPGNNNSGGFDSSVRVKALIIIVAGILIGGVVGYVVSGFEKRNS